MSKCCRNPGQCDRDPGDVIAFAEQTVNRNPAPADLLASLRGSAVTLDRLYAAATATEGDMRVHVPRLRWLAQRVSHITEFGVRTGVSTVALLAGQPRVMRSYDIQPCIMGTLLEQLARPVDYKFTVADTAAIEIEPTELLFIDTLHTYDHLHQELTLHADKVSQYIVLHDTNSFPGFGKHGCTAGTRGMWPAIGELLVSGQWGVCAHWNDSWGLTVLERLRP